MTADHGGKRTPLGELSSSHGASGPVPASQTNTAPISACIGDLKRRYSLLKDRHDDRSSRAVPLRNSLQASMAVTLARCADQARV